MNQSLNASDREGEHQRRARALALVSCCETEEVEGVANAAVLQSEFARVLTSSIALELLDSAQFCRSFALAAVDVAEAEPHAWPADKLWQLAGMCDFFGDANEALRVEALIPTDGSR